MTATRTTATSYDVARFRRDFPILEREVYGKPLVYLDNAASTQKPRVAPEKRPSVIKATFLPMP